MRQHERILALMKKGLSTLPCCAESSMIQSASPLPTEFPSRSQMLDTDAQVLSAKGVFGTVRDVQEAIVSLVLVIYIRHQGSCLWRSCTHEKIDRLIRSYRSIGHLIDVLVYNVLEFTAEHGPRNQEFFFVNIGKIGTLSFLTNNRNTVWILGQYSLRFCSAFLKRHSLLKCHSGHKLLRQKMT